MRGLNTRKRTNVCAHCYTKTVYNRASALVALFLTTFTTVQMQTQRRRQTLSKLLQPVSINATHAGGASRAYTTKPKPAHCQLCTGGRTSTRGGLGLSPFRAPGRCGGRWNSGPALPATPPSQATSSRTSRRSRTSPRGKCVRQPFRGRGPLISLPTLLNESVRNTRSMRAAESVPNKKPGRWQWGYEIRGRRAETTRRSTDNSQSRQPGESSGEGGFATGGLTSKYQ